MSQALEHPAQEKFCQLVVSGESYEDAYAQCYPEEVSGISVPTLRKRAKTLARVLEVVTRIGQLRGPVIMRARKQFQYTVDDLVEECDVASEEAARLGDPGSMLRATELKGKLLKLLGGEHVRRERELDGVSVEELLDLLTELRVRKQALSERAVVMIADTMDEAGADLV